MDTKDLQKIRDAGMFHLQSRQVSKRMSDLMPDRIKAIIKEYRRRNSAGRAERLALTDDRWLKAIDELVDRRVDGQMAKVRWDIGRMRTAAERSLNSWNRAMMQQARKRRQNPPFVPISED